MPANAGHAEKFDYRSGELSGVIELAHEENGANTLFLYSYWINHTPSWPVLDQTRDYLEGRPVKLAVTPHPYAFNLFNQHRTIGYDNYVETSFGAPNPNFGQRVSAVLGGAPADLAEQSNVLQEIAERSRLGIPVTISTDPRHHFQYVLGASVTAGQFSEWPEPLGFAALGDSAVVRRFGDIARQEYRAVGIRMALSPQADLATEPRWSRTGLPESTSRGTKQASSGRIFPSRIHCCCRAMSTG